MTREELREHARRVAATAPPLTDEQKIIIRLAFANRRPTVNQEYTANV